jgi:murein DD-endopeptidase MepM/ murein hydrolase activator NlpD
VNIPVEEENVDAQLQTYTIQEGDNFWTLSKKFNIPYEDVLAANPDKDPKNLYPGLKVKLPIASSTYPYEIKAGDDFWKLSQRLNIPYNDILAANPDVNPRNLYPGQVVQIPNKSDEPQSDQSQDAPAEPNYLADGVFPLKKDSYTPFTNTYGDGRTYNADGTLSRKHEGIDIIAPKGTPVYSVYDGVVMNRGWNTLGGWRLTIKTPDGKTAFYYAHMSKYAPNIEMGSKITKGQLIGYVGDTGYGEEGTSGEFIAHLHVGMYDLTNNFSAVNPYQHLKFWESQN